MLLRLKRAAVDESNRQTEQMLCLQIKVSHGMALINVILNPRYKALSSGELKEFFAVHYRERCCSTNFFSPHPLVA